MFYINFIEQSTLKFILVLRILEKGLKGWIFRQLGFYTFRTWELGDLTTINSPLLTYKSMNPFSSPTKILFAKRLRRALQTDPVLTLGCVDIPIKKLSD
jgi:hypothetical protein